METQRKNIVDYLPFLVNRIWRSATSQDYKLLSYEVMPVAFNNGATVRLKFEGGVNVHCDIHAIIYTPILRTKEQITREEISQCVKLDGNMRYANQEPEIFVKGWVSFKPEVTKYLLNQGIDLFGLIENNLAIKQE